MKIYLYVKTHLETGLKYFGKTTANPFSYSGSGKYWKRHLEKHGNNVKTEIFGIFESEEECTSAALQFSRENDIVNDEAWANLREENGLDGAPLGAIGHKHTRSELEKMSVSMKKKWEDVNYQKKLSEVHRERWNDELKARQSQRLKTEYWTEEQRKHHSEKMTGRKMSEEQKQKLRKPKRDGHSENVSKALKGKPKSELHRLKLKEAASRKTVYVTRLIDKKEMRLTEFNKWVKYITRHCS